MDNLRRAGLTLLIMAVVVLSAALADARKKPVVKLVSVQTPIPSVREIQQRLKALDDPRYDPDPIDGIPGPKMIAGWDNYTCDQYAIRSIEGR